MALAFGIILFDIFIFLELGNLEGLVHGSQNRDYQI